ncbi:MAG TPA: hypothetical protein V6D17_16425 [Candidatus Obscuribacterales bacterium]
MSDSASLWIGELLTRADLVSSQEIQEAINLAGQNGLPLGQVLIIAGKLSEEELAATMQAQSHIRDEVLEIKTAIDALKLVRKKKLSLDQALEELEWSPSHQKAATATKLGELLMGAELISADDLERSVKAAAQSGLPLARIITAMRLVSPNVLTAALTAQVLLRDGIVNHEQAVEGLKAAKQRSVSLEQSLKDQGLLPPRKAPSIHLGQLLRLSGLITETDVIEAIEASLSLNQPIGQVLVAKGLITRDLLYSALRVQAMVTTGQLIALQGIQVVRRMHTQGISLEQAISTLSMTMPPVSDEVTPLADLLKKAAIVNDNDIKRAFDIAYQNSEIIGRVLLIAGTIDEPLLEAATRCQTLLRQGMLSEDQAIVALQYCQRSQITLYEALEQIGWRIKSNGPEPNDRSS